jgi:hypothetical protein
MDTMEVLRRQLFPLYNGAKTYIFDTKQILHFYSNEITKHPEINDNLVESIFKFGINCFTQSWCRKHATLIFNELYKQ